MNPEQLFEEITQFVSDSREVLKQGAMMELAGLENRILLLCKEVIQLSKEERGLYADRLQRLMADLTALGEEITLERDKVGDAIRNLPSHQKAHKAYRVTGAGKKDDEGSSDE